MFVWCIFGEEVPGPKREPWGYKSVRWAANQFRGVMTWRGCDRCIEMWVLSDKTGWAMCNHQYECYIGWKEDVMCRKREIGLEGEVNVLSSSVG